MSPLAILPLGEAQRAAVPFHDPTGYRKPDPGAGADRLSGEEWVEHARTNGVRNPRSVVGYLDLRPFVVRTSRQPHSARLRLLLKGLARIRSQTHKGDSVFERGVIQAP